MTRALCGIGGALLAIAAALTPVKQAAAQTATVGKLDAKTSGSSVRASQLMGANIQNPQGEGVGEVNDIVVDGATGKVQYAAVTYGGAFGIGNKMFAVPWEAFKCVQDPDDADDYYLVLNVTQKTLDGARGFDEENWPNFADQAFRSELDRRYGVKRATGVNVDAKKQGVDVNVERN